MLSRASSGGLNYRSRTANGFWSMPVQIGPAANHYDLVADHSGSVHFVWAKRGDWDEEGVFYRARSAAGGFGPTQAVPGLENFNQGKKIELELGPDNSLHLVALSGGDLLDSYLNRSPAGNWSAPFTLPIMENCQVKVDSFGQLHAFYQYANKALYQVRYLDGSWSQPFISQYLAWTAVSIDKQNRVALIESTWPNIRFSIQQLVKNTYVSSAEQQVAIPAGMHKPTLALMVRGSGLVPPAGLPFSLSIREAGGKITSVPAQAKPGWEQRWFDLSPWAGRTITLNLSFTLVAGDMLQGVVFDNISLGSWLTPVITHLSPSYLDRSQPVEVSIIGNNFIPTPTVSIGGVPLSNLRWQNENLLLATLPANTPLGQSDVQITNPGGISSWLVGGFKLGSNIFLPNVSR